jgi:hypothetical protein
MIQLRNLEKRYQTRAGFTYVLRQIHLDVDEGDFITFMGPSGAGKNDLRFWVLDFGLAIRRLATGDRLARCGHLESIRLPCGYWRSRTFRCGPTAIRRRALQRFWAGHRRIQFHPTGGDLRSPPIQNTKT